MTKKHNRYQLAAAVMVGVGAVVGAVMFKKGYDVLGKMYVDKLDHDLVEGLKS